jgi:putative acetyltransferase
MNILIRAEREDEHRKVEEITRDSFWNLYMPGANEHFILNNLRKSSDFIQKLCLVAIDIKTNKILGNIVYSLARIQDDKMNNHQILTFGPVSVLSSYKRNGIGSLLIKASMKQAAEMGFKAIVILGNHKYYDKFGFENGIKFGISSFDGSFPKGLLVKELYEGSLNGIKGKFYFSSSYQYDQTEFEKFDNTFEFKEKFITPSQKIFNKIVNLKYHDPDPDDLDLFYDNITRS